MGSRIDVFAIDKMRESKLECDWMEICEKGCRNENNFDECRKECMQKYYYSGAPYYNKKIPTQSYIKIFEKFFTLFE